MELFGRKSETHSLLRGTQGKIGITTGLSTVPNLRAYYYYGFVTDNHVTRNLQAICDYYGSLAPTTVSLGTH